MSELCPTCGQRVQGEQDAEALLLALHAHPREVYRIDGTKTYALTHTRGARFPESAVMDLVGRGELVRTYAKCPDSFSLPGYQWRGTPRVADRHKR